MAEILLMEPNPVCGEHRQRLLNDAGHHCTLCPTVQEALGLLENGVRTMTVLNARMPWTESAPFLRALQQKGLPVLFLTAETQNEAHLRALYQADCDVLDVSCSDEALLAAIDHLLATSPATLTLGNLSLNPATGRVTVEGREASLTRQEYALLYTLMLSPNRTISREELLRTAWGYQSMGATRTVDVHIQRLRRKLGPGTIETIYKLGYRLSRTVGTDAVAAAL